MWVLVSHGRPFEAYHSELVVLRVEELLSEEAGTACEVLHHSNLLQVEEARHTQAKEQQKVACSCKEMVEKAGEHRMT
jgi:hypothetical protein